MFDGSKFFKFNLTRSGYIETLSLFAYSVLSTVYRNCEQKQKLFGYISKLTLNSLEKGVL